MSRHSLQITSIRNPFLQRVRRAAATGAPTEEGLLVAEGPHLVEEAFKSTWLVEQIVVTAENRRRHRGLLESLSSEAVIEVPARAFSVISATETSQGILALLRPRTWTWNDLVHGRILLVVLDGVQDPGNAGTIIRSAEAFGATGVVLLRNSVRIGNSKFLRATAGSIFRLPYLADMEPAQLHNLIREAHVHPYALAVSKASKLLDANLQLPCALIVGSEGAGVSPEVLEWSHAITIPTHHVESLNAAVACSIALYEAKRQRDQHEPV